jgi:type I restriction enzyme S subunit
MSSATTLGEIAEFVNGAAFSEADWSNVGMKIIRIQNLTDPTKPFNRTTRQVKDAIVVRPGDLLVSWSATLGVFEWRESEDALLNQHIFRVIPDVRRVDKSYLRHVLDIAVSGMGRHTHGATMKHINRAEFLGTSIPLPPLEEQRRIASILDASDALRTKRRQALEKLDSLTQSIFVDMFGDERERSSSVAQLSDLTSVITKGTTPTSVGFDFADGGIPFVRVQDLQDGSVQAEDVGLWISEATHRALSRSILRPRDVLISIAGTIGRVAIVPESAPEMNCNQAVALIRTTPALNAEYLAGWLNTEDAQRQIGSSRVTGTISNLSLTSIRSLRLPLPTPATQSLFAQRTMEVRQLQKKSAASLTVLDSLFSSIQRSAFRGEL